MPIDTKHDSLAIALKKLQARENTLLEFEKVSKLGSWEIDLQTNKSLWSQRSYEIYRIPVGTEVTIKTFFSRLSPYDAKRAKSVLDEALHTKEAISFTTQARREDGSIITVLINGQAIFNKNGTPLKLIGTTQDITHLIALKSKYKKQANILKNIHDAIITTDTYGNITSWNKGSSLLFGYIEAETLGEYIGLIYDDMDNVLALDEVFSNLQTSASINMETNLLTKDNSKIICNMSLNTLFDESGNIDGYLGYIQDITSQKEAQKLIQKQAQQLQHQAYHDTLTKLPNRALFKDRLEQTILYSKRNNKKFALLFIDLDQFKQINDSMGHNVGDTVLIEFANRLKNSLRAEDTLARLGGDEFTVILKNISESKSITNVATKIIQSLKEAFKISSNNLYISCSVGISIYPDDTTSMENLIKYADAAMYKAKAAGRGMYQFYSSEMTALAYERVIMENSLRIAIKERQFLVYFQPQYEANTKKIVGMEALVRWEHPQMGLVFPNNFLPIAQETGLITEIDKIVMQKAMQQFEQWYKEGYNPGVLALNLSMKQLQADDFIPQLLKSMQKYNFNPKWLELEVLENEVMDHPDASIQKLNVIHNLGVEIAIDDFGTGYSSLSYLKKLPLDKLKIDKSFIDDIPECEDDIAITKAIIALGNSLNLKLIAEGVETKEQLDFLIQNGCNYIQGYYFSKPVTAEKIKELLNN